MTELYVATRDASITVALMGHGKREALPPYVTGPDAPTSTSTGSQARVRRTGGMTAEQFDRVFPVWAAAHPGGTGRGGTALGAVRIVRPMPFGAPA